MLRSEAQPRPLPLKGGAKNQKALVGRAQWKIGLVVP
jgi:hypothetical protein